MVRISRANFEQVQYWNGEGGRSWIELRGLFDRMLKPFEELLVQTVVDHSARHILDVGCGTGSTTLAIARSIAAGGRVVGVDLSEPMLAEARASVARTAWPATFLLADAQNHPFSTGAFDMVISRFGVMFFEDPVTAFSNLRCAAKPGALLRALAWRGLAENEFMGVPVRAAAPLLPQLCVQRSATPNQFALADRERIRSILRCSGWTGMDIERVDVACSMPEAELMHFATRHGPVGRVLRQMDDLLRSKVMDAVLAAFAPYLRDGDARFNSAAWMICAKA